MMDRFENEIKHGQFLAAADPVFAWGWGSPAGKIRAARRANLIISNSKISQTSKVMEIGCGTGLFTEKFAVTGAAITAVDISKELLKTARERNLKNVNFVEKPFENCQAEGPFDAIIGSSVLHHLNVDISFPRILELLKPGGILCFAEPNMLNPQVFAERKFRRFFPQVSPDETAFERRSLFRKLEKLGYVNIKIIPFDWMHPSIPPLLLPLIKTVNGFLEAIPFIREFSGSLLIKAEKPS